MPALAEHEFLYAITGYGNFGSIHTDKWHYLQNIWGKDPGLGPQLYDVVKDHGEERNVVDKHPEIVAKLKQPLEESFVDNES